MICYVFKNISDFLKFSIFIFGIFFSYRYEKTILWDRPGPSASASPGIRPMPISEDGFFISIGCYPIHCRGPLKIADTSRKTFLKNFLWIVDFWPNKSCILKNKNNLRNNFNMKLCILFCERYMNLKVFHRILKIQIVKLWSLSLFQKINHFVNFFKNLLRLVSAILRGPRQCIG